MFYVPIVWLVICTALARRRPGLLLGCVILAFQYDSLYDTDAIGPLVFVVFVGFTILTAIFHRQFFAPNMSDFLVMLFGALYTFSAVYSPDLSTGFNIAGRLVVLCIGYYVIGRFYSSVSVYKNRCIFDFGVSATFLTLVFGYLAVGQQEESGRLLLGEGSAVGFSQMLDIAAGFCLFYLISISGNLVWIKRTGIFLLFIGIIALIVLNATRGTIVGLLFAFCVFLAVQMLQWKPGNRHFSRFLSVGFVMLGASVILLQFSVQADFLSFGFERLRMNFGVSGFELDPAAVSRLNLVQQAWEMFVESPFFGHGAGSFSRRSLLGYPHSVFPELLAETGIFITSVFAIIVVRVGWMALRLFRSGSPDTTIVVGIFLVTLAHQQVSFALWMAKTLFFSMGVIVSLYLEFNKKPASESETATPDSSQRVLLLRSLR